MIIRDAVEQERDIICELRLNAYQEHSSKIPEGHWNVLKQSVLSDTDTQVNVERIVIEIDGEIVGSVALFPAKTEAYKGLVEGEQDYPELRMLAVSTAVRGKGVAKALVNECIRRTKVKGYAAMGLHTSDFMENAVKLYESLGFERLPQADFVPLDDGIVVKAFRITF